MRLVKLVVHRFQCIREAEIEFGPGLNVLFGPNDLGKSSLAWAIRAVLLLQHNSTHHERFVSWYEPAEPRVSLTFADAQNRYWRVTKTFGGSAGRSLLEASKDGRTFSAEANGRQVDEKLRALLGWGLAAAGGGTRTFPDSFLAQVLISEQDNVRKVLFETSLDKDPDESGKQRMIQALNALAQDPMFKKILDNAQERVDEAFTRTGRKKKSAGSPFVETAERIKGFQRDLESLEGRVRESAAAEQKIKELVDLRDRAERDLRDARTELDRMEAGLEIARKRAAIRAEIATRKEQLDRAGSLRADVSRAESELGELEKTLERESRRVAELTGLVASHTAEQRAARERLDALLVDAEGETTRVRLEDQLRELRDQVQVARTSVERTREREQAASNIASAIRQARATLRAVSELSDVAGKGRTAAAERSRASALALEHAKERLREATSDDQVQARELRRSELENQRLALLAEKNTAQALTKQLDDLAALEARIAEARSTCAAHERALASARAAVDETLEAIRTFEETDRTLTLLQQHGEHQAAQLELTAASSAVDKAQRERDAITALRADAARKRTLVRSDLPDAARVTELRRLAEDLRVANARLGGGLSITLRPRRELALGLQADRGEARSIRTAQSTSLSAEQVAHITIEDLIEIEVTAGEESARRDAAALQERWATHATPVLVRARVSALDELDTAVTASATALREAEAMERDATEREARLAGEPPRDLEALAAKVRRLDEALRGADRDALSSRFAKLGANWSTAVAEGRDTAARQRAQTAQRLESQRAVVTRTETQLDAESKAVEGLVSELERDKGKLPDAPSVVRQTVDEKRARLEGDLRSIAGQLEQLASAPDAASTARAEVTKAESVHAAAVAALAAAEKEASGARDQLMSDTARVTGLLDRARDMDETGVWSRALESRDELDVAPWRDKTRRAVEDLAERERACERCADAVKELMTRRAEAIDNQKSIQRRIEQIVGDAQRNLTTATEANRRAQEQITDKRLAIAELRTSLAALHLDGIQAEIGKLTSDLAAIPGDDRLDEHTVERQRSLVASLDARHDEAVQSLARAHGALEQVGGATVREQKAALEEAKAREERREHQLDVEYDAWKLLVETMREAETTEGAHLGRALATPVSQRFRELTEGRYGNLELGPHLEATGLHAAGGIRDFDVLSAGTQDQLATLLRLCVAEQLKSGLVLDDHLSQSDPSRVGWFNSILRAAAHQIQITFITCRPSELLTSAEFPAPADAMRSSAADHVRAIDLTKVIRRFAMPAKPVRLEVPSLKLQSDL